MKTAYRLLIPLTNDLVCLPSSTIFLLSILSPTFLNKTSLRCFYCISNIPLQNNSPLLLLYLKHSFPKQCLEKCILDIKNWMTTNKLKLNGEKRKIMILSNINKSKTFPIDLNHLNCAGEEISIPSANVVRNLGFFFDSNLTMESYIKEVTQSCHFQLKNIGKISDLMDKSIAHMLVHSFVTSRLDYCNCLYAGVPFYLSERLQTIQNKEARLVLRKDRKHDSKKLLRLLHWLPVQKSRF